MGNTITKHVCSYISCVTSCHNSSKFASNQQQHILRISEADGDNVVVEFSNDYMIPPVRLPGYPEKQTTIRNVQKPSETVVSHYSLCPPQILPSMV